MKRHSEARRSSVVGRTALGRAVLALIGGLLALVVPLAPGAAQQSELPDGYGRLLVITNFDGVEVSINGVSYPYESIYDDMNGVIVPADFPLRIVVAASEEQQRIFRVNLEEGETRVLVVDIENLGQAPPRPSPRAEPRQQAEQTEQSEPTDEVGYLGVSSSPRGIVHVDGQSTQQRTPARRIEVPPGRHEVSVFYDEEGVMSETKHVLIRAGVNTNVFFRHRPEAD